MSPAELLPSTPAHAIREIALPGRAEGEHKPANATIGSLAFTPSSCSPFGGVWMTTGRVAIRTFHGQRGPRFTQTLLICVYSSSAALPISRPKPLCL